MSENDVEEARPYPKRGETIWTYGEEDDPVQRTRRHENDKFIIGLLFQTDPLPPGLVVGVGHISNTVDYWEGSDG